MMICDFLYHASVKYVKYPLATLRYLMIKAEMECVVLLF